MKTLLLIILISYSSSASIENYVFNEGQVNLCIFSTNPRNITYLEHMQLRETGFNKNLPTVFVVHGFQSGYNFLELFRAAYGTNLTTKLNLIGVDWSKGAGVRLLDYWWVLPRLSTVGSAVGQFIMAAIKENVISDPNSIHVVGHSLGAHVAGFVGKYMAENSIQLRHITALDPAGPFIRKYECHRRLCDTDASFVETLHTNGGILGMWQPIGQLDLYVNGGSRQPGCRLPMCSHSFSHEWYRNVMTGTPETDGWLCKDLNQMKNEHFCEQDGNPRKYRFEILETKTRELGIVFLPTPGYPDHEEVTPNITEVFTNQPNNYTIVIFANNNDKGVVLASLLSDNGQLVVQHHDNEVIIVNPSNAAWSPDPKYHICHEVQPNGIENCLRDLRKPFKFVVAFDVDDMFTDRFWEMLFHLAKYDSQDHVFSNKLQMVAMNIPHDGIELQHHIDDLKITVNSALEIHYAAVFQMAGMHVIEHNGVVTQMSELASELVDIKNVVDH